VLEQDAKPQVLTQVDKTWTSTEKDNKRGKETTASGQHIRELEQRESPPVVANDLS
jgi:hypothetical protein